MSVQGVRELFGTRMDLLVYNPPGASDPKLALEASRAGALGIIDLEHLDAEAITKAVSSLAASQLPFGVRIDPLGETLGTLMVNGIPKNLKLLVSVPKEGLSDMVRTGVYDTARSMGLLTFQEVCSEDEAADSVKCGADGIIIRGVEGGGRVSSEPTDTLYDAVKALAGKTPVLKRGGIGPKDLKSCSVKGVNGLVLDSQLFTMAESPLPEHIQKAIRSMGADGTTLFAADLGRPFRFLADESSRDAVARTDDDMRASGSDDRTRYKALKAAFSEMIAGSLDGGSVFYPVGSDGAEAVQFEAYGGLLEALSDLFGVERQAAAPPPGAGSETATGVLSMNTASATVDGLPVPPDYHDMSVAIVGIGALFPKGIGVDNYWKAIVDGVDACIEVPKNRWDWHLHYDPDPKVPDKTYSKIGAFIEGLKFDPFEFKIPPKVARDIDLFQRYSLIACKEALIDAKLYDRKDLDRSRIAAIVANSGGGENRDYVALRVGMSEVKEFLRKTEVWGKLPKDVQTDLWAQTWKVMDQSIMKIDEDGMPGGLPNVTSGRLANVFNFTGPNFITDAACASTLASIYSARNGLILRHFDIAVAGGVDSGMSPQGYVEFSKIGALTPDGSRPFSDGANGFLMGEGGGIVILKRLEDAVRDQDKIYAIVRGISGSSDGKGKGITAPNPAGQMMAVKKAFDEARVDPSTISFVEAHGTSTAVGDVSEVMALSEVFKGLPRNSIGLTSVKSQIGHLKSAAGAAGTIKAALAIHHRTYPPQINFEKPNHYIDWDMTPFYVITEPRTWERIRPDVPRRCGVSAFGFGGTNFHMVLEEFDENIFKAYKLAKESARAAAPAKTGQGPGPDAGAPSAKRPVIRPGKDEYLRTKGDLEGEAFLFSSDNPMELLALAERALARAREAATSGGRLRDAVDKPSTGGRYRLGIAVKDVEHFASQLETVKKVGMNEKGLMALAAKGIFVGDRERIDHGKVCFMFPGQGSQYLNMFRELKDKYTIVQDTFDRADVVMRDLIPQPLSTYVYRDVQQGTPEYDQASETLRQTEYNQPSMLTVDTAMYELLIKLGVRPDVVMGHSLGEYGALIASDIMEFDGALKAVSARGREMRDLKISDHGKMASVMTGYKEVEQVLKEIDGYVISANKNCYIQTVIAGESKAVEEAVKRFEEKGVECQMLPVSHAFHSAVVAPAKNILRAYLSKLEIRPPKIPILSNLTADLYPMEGDPAYIKEQVLDLLREQMASTVEWIGQVNKAYELGCRTFVEVGPKRALSSFAYNILEDEVKKGRVFPITSNHPKKGTIMTFNEMVASLWSIGIDLKLPDNDDDTFYRREFIDAFKPVDAEAAPQVQATSAPAVQAAEAPAWAPEERNREAARPVTMSGNGDKGFSEFLSKNQDAISRFLRDLYTSAPSGVPLVEPHRKDVDLSGSGTTVPPRKGAKVVISGAAFGLPKKGKGVFSEENFDLLVEGHNLIDNIDEDYAEKFVEKNIVRLDKKPDGSAEMVRLDDTSKVAHLAGMLGDFDLHKEFGVPHELVDVLDITSRLAFASGLLALKDAGIPLVRRYSQTSTGSFLPEEYELPLELQEDTGIIFASAFPGYNNLLNELAKYYSTKIARARGAERDRLINMLRDKARKVGREKELDSILTASPPVGSIDYHLPRYFMFMILAMGHSQFAQYIKAKGPNTQVNSACATSTLAIGLAQDWIQAGRCKRVLVLGADDPSSELGLEWFGSSLLALGALTPEKDVKQAALPFDRRRKGMIIGSGAVGLVVEAEEEPARRGMEPLVEIMGTCIGNSAFHGARLDIAHIARSMDRFMGRMEKEHDFDRHEIAKDMLFMSHETYTPARGGSSAAEVESLRRTFGDDFRDIIVLNTKGYTGHAFGACVEDPVLIRCLERGIAIPLANLTPSEIDPQFAGMQLSTGGRHDRHYGLRLAAGFGSQIAFLLIKRTASTERYRSKELYLRWLESIATTRPVELEVMDNVLRLKDSGRDNLIPHRAVRRDSSEIGFERGPTIDVDARVFDRYKEMVLNVFCEKTGFPKGTVDIDADLDSDLGLDSVKQVELFAAARISFDLPKDEGVNLKDYPTLRQVINYIINKKEGARQKHTGGTKEAAAPKPAEPLPEKMSDWDRIRDRIVEIVSQKTGYPTDMLDLDLDLEADLGIDTVKQVELFAMSREQFALPRDDTVNLKDFSTLRKIIDYVAKRSRGAAPAQAAPPKAEAPPPAPPAPARSYWDEVKDKVVTAVSQKTGYPPEMLDLDLDLEADLGIDTVKQVELFALSREQFALPRDDTVNLKDFPTLRKIIDYVVSRSAPAGAPVLQPVAAAPVPATAPASEAAAPSQKAPESKEGVAGKDARWNEIREKVVGAVAQKTGYPPEMLELDLDLEADLGIDTVKQVELFALSREQFALPRDDTVNLKDFPTLRKIIDYIHSRTWKEAPEQPAAAPVPAPAQGAEAAPSAAPAAMDVPLGPGHPHWEAIKEKIVAAVSDKTGYPPEMLELDLNLEADLGIDTVKQVELFALSREQFALPRDDTISLKDFPTLRHIVDYMAKRTLKEQKADAPKEPAPAPVPVKQLKTYTVEELKDRVNRWVLHADKVPMVPSGESPVSGKRALVIGGGTKVRNMLERILGIEALPVGKDASTLEGIDLASVQGIVCVHPLFMDADPDPSDWDAAGRETSKVLFQTVSALDKQFKEGGFLYSVTAMGGRFGLDREVNPFNGAVSGFTKAVKKEYTSADVISLDVDPSIGLESAVKHLLDEVSLKDHPLEVGFDGEDRYVPVLRIMEQPEGADLPLRDGMSILVTGGGGGITAEIVKGLAKRAHLKLHLLDIAEVLPDVERLAAMDPSELAALKEGIKDHLKAEGKKVTPVLVDREFSKVTRSIDIFRLLADIRALGSEVSYHRADVRDSEAVIRIGSENGPFNGIIHAAGVEQSKLLVSKTREDFDRVFDIKVLGAKALLEATRDHPLEFFMGFTSVAGRFGNAGQVDYASANDTLAKLHGAFTKYHPGCRVRIVGWSAWADVGMASRGSVKTILELGGVKFIPVNEGVEYAISEIMKGSEREVYYSGSLGPLDREGQMKWSEGVHPFVPPEAVTPKEVPAKGVAPLIDEVMEQGEGRLLLKRTLDGKREAFLPDHMIMGTMVLPGVMGLEIFAEAASLLVPDKDVLGIEGMVYNKAVNVEGETPVLIECKALEPDEFEQKVEVRLFSKQKDRKGKEKEVEHYSGTVVMGSADNVCMIVEGHPMRPRSVTGQVERSAIYQHLFHGPSFRVMEGMALLEDDEMLGIYHLPDTPVLSGENGWKDAEMRTSPLQTELGFQSAGVFVMERYGMMALPVKVGSIRYSSVLAPDEPCCAWVRSKGRKDNIFSFDVDLIDLSGNIRISYTDYRLKALMKYDGKLAFGHTVRFEELSATARSVRAFRLDMEQFGEGTEAYRGLFSDAELEALTTGTMVEKRRSEHIAGRVASKLGAAWALLTQRCRVVPWQDIKVMTEEGGRPYIDIGGERMEASISHSGKWAVASVGTKPHGIDIETIAPRDPSFSGEAFSENEMASLSELEKEAGLPPEASWTLLFSAKEAVLKKKGIGLSVPLRDLECKDIVRHPGRTGAALEMLIAHEGKEDKVVLELQDDQVMAICV